MGFRLQEARVRVGGAAEEGRLVFQDEVLLAVLTRLPEQHEDLAGMWFLEHGFGPLDGPSHPTFVDLDAAEHWIARQLNRSG